MYGSWKYKWLIKKIKIKNLLIYTFYWSAIVENIENSESSKWNDQLMNVSNNSFMKPGNSQSANFLSNRNKTYQLISWHIHSSYILIIYLTINTTYLHATIYSMYNIFATHILYNIWMQDKLCFCLCLK